MQKIVLPRKGNYVYIKIAATAILKGTLAVTIRTPKMTTTTRALTATLTKTILIKSIIRTSSVTTTSLQTSIPSIPLTAKQ